MRRRFALVMALSACNSAFGLEQTHLVDGPPPDAPARCTPLGAPLFSPLVTQAVLANCRDYTLTNGRAMATCFDLVTPAYRPTTGEGPIDGPLETATIAPTGVDNLLLSPRLSPEGELFVIEATRFSVPLKASVYTRDAAGWQWARDLPFALTTYRDQIGTPSRAPSRRMMITTEGAVLEAVEDDSGIWTTTPYTAAELGVREVKSAVNLSADGLRAVFSAATDAGEDRVFYTSRLDPTTRFAGATALDVPYVTDAFLTEDCARLYFSGVGSVFYTQQ
jgi:hypothetical protein